MTLMDYPGAQASAAFGRLSNGGFTEHGPHLQSTLGQRAGRPHSRPSVPRLSREVVSQNLRGGTIMEKCWWKRWVLVLVVAVLTAGLTVGWTSLASAADSEEGQTIYKKRCAMCHGATGAGDGPMGKMLKPPPASFTDAARMGDQTDEALEKRIKEGKSPMPSYGNRLSDSQIKNVLAYIRTLAGK